MEKGKYKIFQDATQGYIEVEDIYVDNLIDSIYVQREKNVSQVGIRSVFSGATHDRFSHSLGVYGMGIKMYRSFKQSALKEIDNLSNKGLFNVEKKNDYILLLDEAEVLYNIACLLHDIGHPAFSHSLEYLYDDDYICTGIDMTNEPLKKWNSEKDVVRNEWTARERISLNEKEIKRVLKRYNWIKNKSSNQKTYLTEIFKYVLKGAEGNKNYGLDVNASPHEVMGAFQILIVENLRKRINTVVTAKLEIDDLPNADLMEACAFIARMITGTKYDIRNVIIANDDKNELEIKMEYSLKNCIISLLNGLIDADSIDYLNRNSHFSGYATNNLDVTRLCNAFKVYYDEKMKIFKPCISKSALSSLDDFVQARNFEPKWLYSHHKIVYFNEVLIEYLMKISSAYMYGDMQKKTEELLLNGLFGKDELYKMFDFADVSDLVDWTKLYEEFLKTPDINYSEEDYWEDRKKYKNILAKSSDIFTNLKDSHSISSTDRQKPIYFKYSILNFIGYIYQKINSSFSSEQNASEILRSMDGFFDFANDIIRRLKYICINYILSPLVSYRSNKGEFFFKSTDANIETIINSFFLSEDEINTSNAVCDFRREMFIDMLEEFKTRKYRKSLWKTFNEYKLFIKKTADKTALPRELVNEEFISLIQSVSGTEHCIEFEDRISAENKPDNMNCIYVNCSNVAMTDLQNQKNKIQDFQSVFNCLGDKMVIRLHQCKFKNFDSLEIYFDDRKIEKYGDVSDYNTPKSYCFPYIYYVDKNENNSKPAIEILVENFSNYLSNQITRKYIKTGGDEMGHMIFSKGKIIRDSVHGDIFVEEKYLDIINTAAFQRLHRIRQLATANMIFPEAVHTRFAHSIGTFHVMNLIINHFCNILDELKIKYTQEDKCVVLVAALLHDIGHGPFSHALEEITDINNSQMKSHEKWTIQIIQNDEELNQVLEKNFGALFVQKVINCLKNNDNEHNTLNKVFHELISSNLDADRLDYLLRDSYNTGEKIGIFDLQKLISSMELTEYNGDIRVVVKVGALQYLDQYILGRYHMYSSVYYAPFKLATEELFRRLCKIVVMYPQEHIYSSNAEVLNTVKAIENFKIYKLCAGTITDKEYLAFDDYSIVNEINQGLSKIFLAEKNEIYQMLADSFMYRNESYCRMRIGNNGRSDFDKFYHYMLNKFPYFDELKSVIKISGTFSAYTKNEDNEILIISNNGEVKPYSYVSKFASNFNEKNKLFASEYCYFYFNKNICDKEINDVAKAQPGDAEKIEELFKAYDLKNNTEIENKYHCTKKTLDEIIQKLTSEYEMGEYVILPNPKEINQKDVYYDTDSFALAKNGYSLRIRDVNKAHILTIKKPGDVGNKATETQFIRLEFERECPENNIADKRAVEIMEETDLQSEVRKRQNDFNYSDLRQVIAVSNNRKAYLVKYKNSDNILFEISLDNVEYKNLSDSETKHVYQIEIELKENYLYRINLNEFANDFCEKFGIEVDGNKPKQSKYLESLTLFQLI